MKLSSELLNDEFPIRYFYCTLEDKEFILTGDREGLIYDTDICTSIGNILIEIMEFEGIIINLLTDCQKNIMNKNYHIHDEILNQNTVLENLHDLQLNLVKNCPYFRFTDVVKDISKKYITIFNESNLKNQKYINDLDTFDRLQSMLSDTFEENVEFKKNINKRLLKQKRKNEKLQNTDFKDFVLEQLSIYIEELHMTSLNILLYCQKAVDDNLTAIEKINMISHNYNFVSDFRKFSCFIKAVDYKNGKIITDDELDDLSNKDLRFIQIFEFTNIIELLNLIFINLTNKKIHMNICTNCANFFIPTSRTDEVYCNRKSPQNPNKTCKEYGAKKTYRDEIKSIPIKYEHNKTSQFFRMRINRANTTNTKDKEMYQKKFNTYKENYQKKKEQYQSGKLKEKDFVEWIIKQKEGVKNGNTRNHKK